MNFSKLAYRKAQLLKWQFAGKTAHFWHNQKAIERARAEIIKWKKLIAELSPKAVPASPITMYDSVDIGTVPGFAQAVAGYVGGNWPTYDGLVKRFPKAHHLSIAVNAGEDAECLDIETGDATPADAPNWVRRQHARGIKRPVVYANASTMPSVLNALSAARIGRNEYRVWTAHYTYRAHIEPGSDATQYTDKALGRNLDASLCSPTFFD